MRTKFDISELYDLFQTRSDCYFVCCDIKHLVPINEISRKAGDLAINESLRRMEEAAGENDIVFRIGGDEFVILTDSPDEDNARRKMEKITAKNGEPVIFEGREIPLSLHSCIVRLGRKTDRYNELFTALWEALNESK